MCFTYYFYAYQSNNRPFAFVTFMTSLGERLPQPKAAGEWTSHNAKLMW